MASLLSNLATIQMAKGYLPAARARMERAIAIMAKHYDPDHPSTKLAAAMLRAYDPPGP